MVWVSRSIGLHSLSVLHLHLYTNWTSLENYKFVRFRIKIVLGSRYQDGYWNTLLCRFHSGWIWLLKFYFDNSTDRVNKCCNRARIPKPRRLSKYLLSTLWLFWLVGTSEFLSVVSTYRKLYKLRTIVRRGGKLYQRRTGWFQQQKNPPKWFEMNLFDPKMTCSTPPICIFQGWA